VISSEAFFDGNALISLAGRLISFTERRPVDHLIFECDAFRIVLFEPSLRSLGIGEGLDVIVDGRRDVGCRRKSRWFSSQIPLQLALAPMRLFAIRIELALVVAV
jgi:hypothetical protein